MFNPEPITLSDTLGGNAAVDIAPTRMRSLGTGVETRGRVLEEIAR